MTTSEIRTGVIGLGYFGSFHARQHAANPKGRLVAVVDAHRERAETIAAQYEATPFTDHRELIGKVDAVSITVPTSLHHAVAADFIDAGVHVLIEKPICDTPESARDLIARAEANNVVLQIGHIERFSPVFGLLRDKVRAPLTVECVRIGPWKGRAIDVDVVLDLMIHDIDLVLALVNSEVVAVEAMGSPVLAPTNDFAQAQLRFANGTVAHLHASRIADRAERTIKVVEPDLYWSADLAARTVASFPRGHAVLAPDEIAVPPSDNLALEIDSFLSSIAGSRRPVVDGKAGLDALVVADMIIQRIGQAKRPASSVLIGEQH
ncbi:UDP-N-acetylglucosamine 3-dehydrogenase [Kaistia sp. 32K]|uniref:Gfo/Idh/MocA family protein n=1 Tax=Kaistia sp. 32K TaxID=2795690 RepID=UPI0019161655|nr:Gfo/Idh/MocA family oxidoreductase [Kaistia sp. 32K]BCP54083.1 UDP-N-acetylglucosamine 3-dehydrogenase [Kaistia sp. 32K]